jgi:hypothetical protein
VARKMATFSTPPSASMLPECSSSPKAPATADGVLWGGGQSVTQSVSPRCVCVCVSPYHRGDGEGLTSSTAIPARPTREWKAATVWGSSVGLTRDLEDGRQAEERGKASQA